MYLKDKIMKPKFLFILCSFLVSLGIISCIKDDVVPAGDAGKTFVKFNDGPSKALFYSPFSDIKDVNVFNIRRDPNSEDALNKAQSITVKLVPQLITDYNTAHGTNFELLPANFYTYNFEPGMSVVGDDFTINYAAGEFAKNLAIKLDGALWTDLSKSYALAYVVTNTAGNTLSAAKDTMMTFFSIKNQWDGVYEISGTMVDVFIPALVHVNVGLAAEGFDPLQIELRTISPTKCAFFDPLVIENYGSPIWNSSTNVFSGYGGFSIVVEFDPVTGNPIAVTNRNGQQFGGNIRSGSLDPSGINTYDPITKTISIKYNMSQEANINPPLPPPFIRTTWDEVWTFKKDRE
jgi:hypothetical protein